LLLLNLESGPMGHTNIMQAEENDLVNILSLQKKSFMVVAERMNKFDLPPFVAKSG